MATNDRGSNDSQEFGEAVDPSSGREPGPGDIIVTGGSVASMEPLVGSGDSSPLEEDAIASD